MTSEAYFVHPPRIAVWLVNLFTPIENAESILGDLFEEFSQRASKSGVAVARSWYWRQTAKTIAHLAMMGFRIAPWATTAAVVGGLLLSRVVYGWPDKVLSAVTDRYLTFWSSHFKAYIWMLNGMSIAHIIIASMFIGCVVALAAKGREMVATMTLGLVLYAMVAVAFFGWVVEHWPINDALSWMLFQCSGPFWIVVGGAVVRMRRSAVSTRPSLV